MRVTAVLSALAAGFIPLMACASTGDGVPVCDSFESYPDGFRLVGTNGWSAPLSAAVTVSNHVDALARLTNWYDQTSCGYPLNAQTHTQVVVVAGPTTNSFGLIGKGDLWFDLMIDPAPWTNTSLPTVAEDAMFAFHRSTGGHVVVAHSSDTAPAGSNVWTQIDAIALSSSAWARITVNMRSVAEQSFFAIRIDGSDPVTNHHAYTAPSDAAARGGTWFPCANFRQRLAPSALSLAGSCFLDDWVVRTGAPVFEKTGGDPVSVVPVYDPSAGTVSPGNAVEVPYGGSSPFTVQAAQHYHIAEILTNGAALADYDFGGSPTRDRKSVV